MENQPVPVPTLTELGDQERNCWFGERMRYLGASRWVAMFYEGVS